MLGNNILKTDTEHLLAKSLRSCTHKRSGLDGKTFRHGTLGLDIVNDPRLPSCGPRRPEHHVNPGSVIRIAQRGLDGQRKCRT